MACSGPTPSKSTASWSTSSPSGLMKCPGTDSVPGLPVGDPESKSTDTIVQYIRDPAHATIASTCFTILLGSLICSRGGRFASAWPAVSLAIRSLARRHGLGDDLNDATRSSGCTVSLVPHCFSSSSVRPQYSRTFLGSSSVEPELLIEYEAGAESKAA